MDYSQLANDESLAKTMSNLETNGITAIAVENKEEAKAKVLSLIPQGKEVMTMTSVTLDEIGLTEELNSDKYDSIKNKLVKMNRETQGLEMQRLGTAQEYAIGSVHAVTEDGAVVIASNTGSQLPAYAYGAENLIWVVGTQKIVPNLDEAMKRIKEYIVPQESVRARKAYGLPETWHTNISKILVVHKEVRPGRITVIFVKEKLGF